MAQQQTPTLLRTHSSRRGTVRRRTATSFPRRAIQTLDRHRLRLLPRYSRKQPLPAASLPWLSTPSNGASSCKLRSARHVDSPVLKYHSVECALFKHPSVRSWELTRPPSPPALSTKGERKEKEKKRENDKTTTKDVCPATRWTALQCDRGRRQGRYD